MASLFARLFAEVEEKRNRGRKSPVPCLSSLLLLPLLLSPNASLLSASSTDPRLARLLLRFFSRSIVDELRHLVSLALPMVSAAAKQRRGRYAIVRLRFFFSDVLPPFALPPLSLTLQQRFRANVHERGKQRGRNEQQ